MEQQKGPAISKSRGDDRKPICNNLMGQSPRPPP
jgi:hypothetical protein